MSNCSGKARGSSAPLGAPRPRTNPAAPVLRIVSSTKSLTWIPSNSSGSRLVRPNLRGSPPRNLPGSPSTSFMSNTSPTSAFESANASPKRAWAACLSRTARSMSFGVRKPGTCAFVTPLPNTTASSPRSRRASAIGPAASSGTLRASPTNSSALSTSKSAVVGERVLSSSSSKSCCAPDRRAGCPPSARAVARKMSVSSCPTGSNARSARPPRRVKSTMSGSTLGVPTSGRPVAWPARLRPPMPGPRVCKVRTLVVPPSSTGNRSRDTRNGVSAELTAMSEANCRGLSRAV
jgi:hypothetical protein